MIDQHDPESPPETRGSSLTILWALIGLAAVALLAAFLLPAALSFQTSERSVRQTSPAGPAIVAVTSTMVDEGSARPQPGEPAPDFRFTLSDGTMQHLSDLHGKKVVINFWATWCAPCRAEMPHIEEIATHYGSDNLVVLAVNRNEDAATIQLFADELGLTFPLITNEAGDISLRYGATGLPTTYFINTDGTIHSRQIGLMDKAFIENRLGDMQ